MVKYILIMILVSNVNSEISLVPLSNYSSIGDCRIMSEFISDVSRQDDTSIKLDCIKVELH